MLARMSLSPFARTYCRGFIQLPQIDCKSKGIYLRSMMRILINALYRNECFKPSCIRSCGDALRMGSDDRAEPACSRGRWAAAQASDRVALELSVPARRT